MATPQQRVIEQISWTYQKIFAWLGIGLASFIGIIELLDNIKKWPSYKLILAELLLGLILLSLEKIMVHQKYIISCRHQLKGWNFPKVEGIFPRILDKLLAPCIKYIIVRIILLLLLVVFVNGVLYEQITGEEMISNLLKN